MLKYYGIIRESARRLTEAIDHTVAAFAEGQVEQEPAFTDRMLGGIEEAMREFHVKGIHWRAKTLTDRGPHAQEKKYGADFMGVLNVDLPDFKVEKGFLAQAKIDGPRFDLHSLHSQCERMLRLSPDSFVFLYSKDGVTVIPAVSVIGTREHPSGLYSRSATRFFEEHFESFIGDRKISAPSEDVLEELRERYEARSLMYLQAKSDILL
jgi:hypothetical protein